MTREPNTMRGNTSDRHVMTTLYNMSRHDNNTTRDLTKHGKTTQYNTRQRKSTLHKSVQDNTRHNKNFEDQTRKPNTRWLRTNSRESRNLFRLYTHLDSGEEGASGKKKTKTCEAWTFFMAGALGSVPDTGFFRRKRHYLLPIRHFSNAILKNLILFFKGTFRH